MSKLIRIGMDNSDFLIEKLHKDCHPLQYVRELTENSIQAIDRMREHIDFVGRIHWCPDKDFDLQKLCIVDNGDGMSPDQLRKYLGNLASGYNKQDISGNYGIGAKISTIPSNPAGVLYRSWQNGVGRMIVLGKHDISGGYGIICIEKDGEEFDTAPCGGGISDYIKGVENNHGTIVTLCGLTQQENTVKPIDRPEKWLSKYLNSRYFEIPSYIQLTVYESSVIQARPIRGMRPFLQEFSEASGVVEFDEPPVCGKVHWWILGSGGETDAGREKRRGTTEYATTTGHVATIYQDELYDFHIGSDGNSYLHNFGIIFGASKVVIYIEPQSMPGASLTTDAARTRLNINNLPFNWSDWQRRFINKMPPELNKFMEGNLSKTTPLDLESRLRDVRELYKLRFYKQRKTGNLKIVPTIDLIEPGHLDSVESNSDNLVGDKSDTGPQNAGKGTGTGGNVNDRVNDTNGNGSNGNPTDGTDDGVNFVDEVIKLPIQRKKVGVLRGEIFAQLIVSNGVNAVDAGPSPIPRIVWLAKNKILEGDEPLADNLSENRFAAYVKQPQDVIYLNADFPVIRDEVRRWQNAVRETVVTSALQASLQQVEIVVRSWAAVPVVETVLGVLGLRNLKNWTEEAVDIALSQEALSAVGVQRYHLNAAVKRELGSKKLIKTN